MISIREIFGVFSSRQTSELPPDRPLTESFRMRVIMRCRDLNYGQLNSPFWESIHHKFQYLLGRPQLCAESRPGDFVNDLLGFLTTCEDKHFLDFIEYIFTSASRHLVGGHGDLIQDINEFFRQDDLPYALTNYSHEEHGDGFHKTISIAAYPQVIRKDSEIVHQNAIEPTLRLLREPGFSTPNAEFLEALEDYRKSDYGDCLTKCASALESVLKIICDQRGWPYEAGQTVAPLLKTVIGNTGLEQFFEQPLILVATIRNRLSKSHGGGTDAREVSPAKAEYTINATAAAILLLVQESRNPP